MTLVRYGTHSIQTLGFPTTTAKRRMFSAQQARVDVGGVQSDEEIAQALMPQ